MKRLPLIFFLLVAGALVYGLMQLFQLRFAAGDVYPGCSTLRADPLGAKAFYESLGALADVQRNHRPLTRLPTGRDTTLFLLGADLEDVRLTLDEFKRLEAFVDEGGRLVIALYPLLQRLPARWSATRAAQPLPGMPTNAPAPPGKSKGSPFGADDDPFELAKIRFTERWGLGLDLAVLSKDAAGKYPPATAWRRTDRPLPETIHSHTALYFTHFKSDWRVIYARTNDQAVVIERPLGRGTMVLLADSYYFSNEALLVDRQSALLAWLVGPNRQVLFDETHLGVQEDPGVVTLARQYRLHGLALALLILALLFVWKNAATFLPPAEEQLAQERGELVRGKDAAAGFVNLLRRNLRPADLLPLCVAEWKKSCGQGVPAARLQQMQEAIDAENARPPKERNPVATYRKFCQILARTKRNA